MNRARKAWQRLVERLPWARPVLAAVDRSAKHDARDMAASIAYFSFLSIFPFLVAVVAAGSAFLDVADIQSRLDRLLSDEFPESGSFINDNVQALVDYRGAAGVASVAVLLWSASKMFGAVSRGINRAFDVEDTQPFYLDKLRNLAITLGVCVLLFAVAALSTSLEVISQLGLGALSQASPRLSSVMSHAGGLASILVVVSLIYKLVPVHRPRWRSVFPGAFLAAFLFELGKTGFVLYIEQVSNLEAIYGSLTSVIVLLVWLYFSARVLLFGAELAGARQERHAALHESA